MARSTKRTPLSSYGKKKTYRKPAGVPRSMSKSRECHTVTSRESYYRRKTALAPEKPRPALGNNYYKRRMNRSGTAAERARYQKRR